MVVNISQTNDQKPLICILNVIIMEKFKNKFRNDTIRAPFWNYGWAAHYFITICTHEHKCWFGDVLEGKIVLSEIGEIVNDEWLKTFDLRPDMNLIKGEFVVMPNHFHALIGIGHNEYNTKCTPKNHDKPMNQFGPQSKNLPSIVRGFKMAVTKNARYIEPDFKWQPLYYDRIVRNEKSHQRITQYILNNPRKWIGKGGHR